MEDVTVRRVLQKYGLEVFQLYPLQKGYRNESHPVRLEGGRLVNLILYKHEPGVVELIRRTNSIGEFLVTAGFPARSPVDGRIMKVSAARLSRYAGIYHYLPGQTIPWEAYTQEHIKLLGKTMAGLHSALRIYDGVELPQVAVEYSHIVRCMQRYFASSQVNSAVTTKLEVRVAPAIFSRLLPILKRCETLAGQQALHMDFVRGNILFSDDEPLVVTGVLDFEKAAYGHPLFDVARTLAFLLVDCKYKPADKVRKYFVASGYQKRGKRRLEHVVVLRNNRRVALLEELLDLFLLYDFYKFLRHNPYEALSQNEHYVRTRSLLLRRGVITTTPIGSSLA